MEGERRVNHKRCSRERQPDLENHSAIWNEKMKKVDRKVESQGKLVSRPQPRTRCTLANVPCVFYC